MTFSRWFDRTSRLIGRAWQILHDKGFPVMVARVYRWLQGERGHWRTVDQSENERLNAIVVDQIPVDRSFLKTGQRGIKTVRVDYKPEWMTRFREMALAHRYCRGEGIELGAAAHNPFGLPGAINVAPFSSDPDSVDYQDFLHFKREQVRLCGEYVLIDLVAEAHDIPLPDAGQDYVLSSHVVEHLPDLIAAFLEWNRLLKPNGIIFMIFPHHDLFPADAVRPITPIDEFIDDYYRGHTVETHPLVEGHGVRGHYHVFTLQSMLDLIEWCNDELQLKWEIVHTEAVDSKIGNGHTVVARYQPDSG